ncbi:hypothetical protein [Corynebacterium cystitidis]|uniref:hypothetical protein n=1 Tax=Corynebacterium cystitidis TaxID=35757 RepID=UPI00211E8C64|nr:hypothetical protein [Corynebacterium cystitidis]
MDDNDDLDLARAVGVLTNDTEEPPRYRALVIQAMAITVIAWIGLVCWILLLTEIS